MLNFKRVLRLIALLVMSLWAQNASALSCGSAAGSLGGTLAAERFANAYEGTCGSTTFVAGPTKDGHIFYSDEFGVTVQFINNGNVFAPASKSLSCTGSTGTSAFSTVMRANFSSTSFSTSCTLTYTDVNSTTVTHSFGASTSSSFGFIVGALNASTVTSGWFERIAPTVTLSAASTLVGFGPFSVIATLSEPVTGFTAADVSTSNLSVVSVTELTPTSYEILVGATSDGPAALQIGAGTMQDLAGNDNTASLGLNLTGDITRPTAAFSGLPATVYTGIPKTVTVTFSEPVTGFTKSDVTTIRSVASSFVAVDASTYTFTLTPTGGGNVALGISPNLAADLAGNKNSGTSAYTARNAGAGTLIAASFSVNPALGISLPHTTFFTDTTTPTSGEAITSWAWDFGDGSTSTTQNPVHNYTTNGVFNVSLQACDAVGCSTANGSVTVATSLANLSATLTGLSGVINGAQTITLTFPSELQPPVLARAARGPVGSLVLSNFVTTNLTLSNLVEISSGPLITDPDVWTFTATPTASGPVSIFLPSSVVQNTVGTLNSASNTLNAIADLTAPTVVLSGLPANLYDVPKTITATFLEPVTGFSLSAADISSTGLTLSNLVAVSGQVYTFDVLAAALGPVSLQINPGAVTDGAGNANPASNLLSATSLGGRAPIAASFTASATILTALPASVSFTDTSTPTSGESITSWAWDFGDASTSTAQNPSHVFSANGVYTVSLTVCDPVGCNSTTTDVNVSTSLAAMTATLSGFSGVVKGAQSITVTLSNRVNPALAGGLTLSDFATTNLTLSNLQQTVTGATNLDSEVWTFTATPDALGAIELSLPAGAVQNFATTANVVSNILTGTENTVPVANAGGDQVVASGAVVTLDASASSDADSTALSYSWSAPTGITLSDATAANPSFTAGTVVLGDPDLSYSFTVTVSDGISSTQDTVLITVRAGVTVTLSGLPTEISGPGSHSVTIDFSRAVTGFTASDITVSGGAVSSLTGSGTSYVAVIEASGSGDLSVSVQASVATDANSIGNAGSNTLAAVNVLNAVTSKEIAHFLQTRNNALLANQPRLAGFLSGGGAGQFSAEISRGGGTVAFDSGTNAPIWARLNANWSTDLGADSQYIFGVVGGHSKMSENLLIGGMFQFDHLREVNGPAVTQGNGWLLGPYFVAKLPTQPLYVEGSLLYGQTSNTVSPLGTYTDAFTTERWLATLGVSGEIERGAMLFTPFLDAKYTSDAQAAYVDGLGNPIAAQTIGLAQASAGINVELALTPATTLNGGLSGVWSYSSGSVLTPGYQGGRARVDLGVAHRFGDCNELALSGFYDGLGAVDFESFGADFKWQTCF